VLSLECHGKVAALARPTIHGAFDWKTRRVRTDRLRMASIAFAWRKQLSDWQRGVGEKRF